jgi:hypothetical protein
MTPSTLAAAGRVRWLIAVGCAWLALVGCASDARVTSNADSGSWSIPIEGRPDPEKTTKKGN